MKTTLAQSNTFFNPYFLDGKQVKKINFFDYKTGLIVFNTDWFSSFGGNNDYPEISFPFEIKRRIKINLDIKQSFYCKSANKGEINIYIPIQLLDNYTHTKDVLKYETETEYTYTDIFSFDLECKKDGRKLNEFEEVEYIVLDSEIRIVKVSSNYKTVLKEFGVKVQNIKDAIKADNYLSDISVYTIERLMKHLNITIK
jgi:hypothetical protein